MAIHRFYPPRVAFRRFSLSFVVLIVLVSLFYSTFSTLASASTNFNGTAALADTRHATVSATVTDTISGPLAPIVSAGANTSRIGRQGLWLVGENNAGVPTQIFCNYTVVPLDLKPTPRVTAVVTSGHSAATVRQLIAARVRLT